MNAISALACAAIVGSICGAAFIVSPVRASDSSAFRAQGFACAGGYHLDGNGDCQPDGGQASLQPCPPGRIARPYPNGSSYRCVEIPASYSQYFR